ncbi:MAG TPA: hypothetical protein VFK32_05570 [Tepidiformaceae bacterium]|nr:hypothetical protein [Tepidiformaceae bacterium]
MRSRTFLAAAAVALFALALGAACSSESGTTDADIVAIINVIDSAGLHDIDDAINEDEEIPAGAAVTAQKLHATMELVEWPSDLDEDAEELSAAFEDLHATLSAETPDMAAAGEIAGRVHDLAHDFSHDAWAYLYAEAGVDVDEEGDGH